MNPLKSVLGRLSIALVIVVAGALGIAYLVVVPRLHDRLIAAKKAQIDKGASPVLLAATSYAATVVPTEDWYTLAEQASSQLGGRVAFFYPSGNPASVAVIGDSFHHSEQLETNRLAIRAATTSHGQSGIVVQNGEKYVENIYAPIASSTPGVNPAPYMLVTAPIGDTLETVSLVKRRLLYAALIALGIALAVGFVGARMFARRIKRLERAADWIAAGHFDEPVVDTGQDELGQLALAFDRMRQRLAQLEHARREFIANASHELRTPLFALAGLLELLDDEELDERTRQEFLSTAREQSDRLTRLATDLLDLNRLDAGRLHVERETVELDEIAEVLSDEFRAVASANEHPLEVLGSPTAAAADEQRVIQIGRVLVDNAILHTPPGTTIRVRTATADGRALLSVADNGPGISSEHVKHVFERFYRVNGAVTSGSGLGLAIAHELAELMGGRIELESRPGLTVFTLSLPLATVATATSLA